MDLKGLVALEQENEELKRLAEHLRKENAEFKRKLGLNSRYANSTKSGSC